MAAWVNFAIWVAATIVQAVLTPKPEVEDAKPAGDGDFRFPRADEGDPWPLLWGTCIVRAPNVLWWGDRKQSAIESDDITVGFRYRFGVQYGLCFGGQYPVDEIRRVWVEEDKLVYDGGGADAVVTDGGTLEVKKPNLFGGDDLGQGGVNVTWQFFAGSKTQSGSSYLADFQTESGQQIVYRSKCYVTNFEKRGYFGNSPSIKPWRWELRRTPNPLGLASATVNDLDANPANVIYEILTSDEFPLQIDASLVDVSNFTAAGNTLASEGNGFSMFVDRTENVDEMLSRLEDQIDGYVYFDYAASKWKIQLARDDYDPGAIQEINDTNTLELVSFSRGSWEDTKNEVRVGFVNRADLYRDTFSPPAQDGANIRIQGARVPITFRLPGVKDSALATSIAWRKLRAYATPLAKGTVVVDRTFYDAHVGKVYALTDTKLGLSRLPVRVTRVQPGTINDGRISLDFVQDVFYAAAGSGGDAQQTLWTPPEDGLVSVDANEQFAFEAPRALVSRYSNFEDPDVNAVFFGSRAQGVETRLRAYLRTNPSSASFTGDPVSAGLSYGFSLIGQLTSSLDAGSAYPFNDLDVTATPDSASDILELFGDELDAATVGTTLRGLLLIDSEFLLVAGSVSAPSTIDIDEVWRGALDSAQADHAAGADVFFLPFGVGVTTSVVGPTSHVEVRLSPETQSEQVDPLDVSVTAITFQMDRRAQRPYPPSEVSLNGSRFPATASLEGSGSGEDVGIGLSFLRRDFRIVDETAQLGIDAASISSDFPTAQDTRHEVEVVDDPSGTPSTLLTQDLAQLTSDDVRRVDILKATGGVLPTTLAFKLRSYHDYAGITDLRSTQDLVWEFSVTSSLSGQFEFLSLDASEVSAEYTASVAGDYDFALSSSFVSGDVEYRLNGGSWTQLIAAGGASGTIVGVSVSDTIELRHLSSDSSVEKLLTMDAPGAGQDCFAVLYT